MIQREEADEDTELVDMPRRFWVAVALSVPVLLLAMLPMLGVTLGIPQNVSRWAQLALSTPVVLWAGWPFFARGWRSFVTWHLSMFTLFPRCNAALPLSLRSYTWTTGRGHPNECLATTLGVAERG